MIQDAISDWLKQAGRWAEEVEVNKTSIVERIRLDNESRDQ